MTHPPQTLADLRRHAGLTQPQVAERMGVAAGRIGQIEATYPRVSYQTLIRYITALGGDVQFIVGSVRVFADQLSEDPSRAATRNYLEQRVGQGNLVYVPSAKKLPLQGEAADSGGDDPGRDEDHAHAESNQSDSGQGQQP